ncbi:hypothetical protein Tco_0085744 [Tanacetum coccineum]
MNELVNDGIKLSKLEKNTEFINGLPMKWLSFCQSLKNTNHVKETELSYLFGKLKYEENLIDSIYDTKKKNSLTTITPLSIAFFSTSIFQDFQDSPSDEEDTRDSQEYLNDQEEEFQERALLAKSKSSSASASKSSMVKNKGLVVEAYEWDEEDVSSDDNEMIEVKVLIALGDDESVDAGKESAKNGEWKEIIFNSNKEVVMIAPRVRDVYVLDMTSSVQQSCFFAKVSERSSIQEDNKLKKLTTLDLMTALKLSNSQNLYNDVSFIEPYKTPEPVVIETDTSSDQSGQADQNDHNDQNDHPVQNNEILNDDQSEHSNHNNDNHIIDNLPNTKDVQIIKPLSSPTKDTSIPNAVSSV